MNFSVFFIDLSYRFAVISALMVQFTGKGDNVVEAVILSAFCNSAVFATNKLV